MTKNLHYLYAPTGLFAIFATSDNTETMHYTFTDHQGSLTAYTTGSSVTRLSYDAWGRRRNADGSYDSVPGAEPVEAFDRGYTGHEHLDAFGLINMNGRLYDPMLGRMLSPDIVVQQTDYTQSYNRYSYCFNNPLRFTDPTGWVVDIDPKYMLMFSYSRNKDLFADEIRGMGIDPETVNFNTEESAGTVVSAVSWIMDGDAYELIRYDRPDLMNGYQKYPMSCAAFCFSQIESTAPKSNPELSEDFFMGCSDFSKVDGLANNIISEMYVEDYSSYYTMYGIQENPKNGDQSFLQQTFNEMKPDRIKPDNGDAVMFVIEGPKGKHTVNAVSAARLSVTSCSGKKTSDYDVWIWNSDPIIGGYQKLNLNSVYTRYSYSHP